MLSEERSKLLQQYLLALASYFDASTEVDDPKTIEELRNHVEKASALLGNDTLT